jgi:hypothetical protein
MKKSMNRKYENIKWGERLMEYKKDDFLSQYEANIDDEGRG